MHLLTAWRDSLALFKPKALKLFLLVTINAVVHSVKIWVKYFWWMLVIPVVLEDYTNIGESVLLAGFFGYWYRLSILLVLRPSVRRKTTSYVLSCLPQAMMMTVFVVLYSLIFSLVALPLIHFFYHSTIAILCINALAKVYLQVIIIYSLFCFDSPIFSYGAILKAVRMVLYNLPLFLPIVIVRMATDFIPVTFAGAFVSIVVGYLWLALVTNIYIKKVHDQFSLYFPKKG